MHIDSLRYFVELTRVGSFYRAAKNVFISQQGLNRSITSLESELGVKLIERESHGVRLTSAGEVFVEHANILLEEYSDMLKDLYAQHAATDDDDARLVIHMTYYVAQVSEPFIKRMKDPSSLNIVEEPFNRIVEGARESDGTELFLCDLHGVHDQERDFPGLVFEPMIASRAGLVWRDELPVATRRAIHRDQIADLPLTVDSHREMMQLAEYIMEDYPLNRIRMGMADPKRRIEFIEATDGVASIYDSFGYALIQANPRLANANLKFTPFSTPRSIMHIGFLNSKHTRPNVRCRHVIELLRQHIRREFADYLEEYEI